MVDERPEYPLTERVARPYFWVRYWIATGGFAFLDVLLWGASIQDNTLFPWAIGLLVAVIVMLAFAKVALPRKWA